MLDLIRAKTDHFYDQGFKLEGVVHVGAHIGQEIPWYLYREMKPVIAIEPQPMVFEELRENFENSPDVFLYNTALGSEFGELTLHVYQHLHPPYPEDTMSASALQMNKESGYEWGDRPNTGFRDVIVPVVRFDSLAPMMPIEECNVLVIDVQGMELNVLEGFGDILYQFDFVSVECSRVPIYEGEAPAWQVIDFLRMYEFWQDSEIQSHDDIMFVRKGLR